MNGAPTIIMRCAAPYEARNIRCTPMRGPLVQTHSMWLALVAATVIGATGGCESSKSHMRRRPHHDGGTESSGSSDAGISAHAATDSIDAALAELPRNDAGLSILIQTKDAQLVVGPREKNPMSGAARCTDWLNHCIYPSRRPLSECVERVPVCVTQEPWNEPQACCPRTCLRAYRSEIDSGRDELEAWLAIWGEPHACFPGLRTHLELAR